MPLLIYGGLSSPILILLNAKWKVVSRKNLAIPIISLVGDQSSCLFWRLMFFFWSLNNCSLTVDCYDSAWFFITIRIYGCRNILHIILEFGLLFLFSGNGVILWEFDFYYWITREILLTIKLFVVESSKR